MASLKSKKLLPLLAVVLLAVIVYALWQMGALPFGGSDSSAGTTGTTQLASTGSGGVVTTTTVTAGTTDTTVASEAQAYLKSMNDWAATYWTKADGAALVFKKLLSPTSAEIQRAKDYVNAMHASLAAVKGIQAPQEVASAHAQFVSALSGEVTALDRLVRALKSKNSRDIELAFRTVNQWRDVEAQAQEVLGPYLNKAGGIAEVTTPSTSTTVVGEKVTFSDTTHGFSLEYPRTWTAYTAADLGIGSFDVPAGAMAFAIGDPTAGSSEGRPIYYMIISSTFADPMDNTSAAGQLADYIAETKSRYPTLSVVSAIRTFKLNGLDAADVTVSYSTQVGSHVYKVMNRLVHVHTSTGAVTLRLWGEKAKWTAESKVLDAMANSIRVMAPSPGSAGVSG